MALGPASGRTVDLRLSMGKNRTERKVSTTLSMKGNVASLISPPCATARELFVVPKSMPIPVGDTAAGRELTLAPKSYDEVLRATVADVFPSVLFVRCDIGDRTRC